jgi:isoaspartyl peptidase/L-asparaginase-like protein (Ntn-hydrolase superfamily)
MDAVEKGINDVEDDPSTGKYFIGRGCYPNSEGVVQLDAAMMRGSDCRVGSVAALEGYSKPVSVARHILEHTQQSLVVGGGARTYAEQNGFQLEANDSLMTDETREKYQLWKESKSVELKEKGHDTLCKQLFWSNIL